MELKDIYIKYPNRIDCVEYLEELKWKSIPFCPYCNSRNFTKVKSTIRYHCNNCNTSYSVLVDTIFKSTKLDLQKWFVAINLILVENEGLSMRKLANKIKVTKDTAWRMNNEIKKYYFEGDILLNKIIN
tara:strand:- start:915 stop:1301 length:387 start_codon:yes stop_codon:yes gene_type:complete